MMKVADTWEFRFRKSIFQVKEKGDLLDQRADHFEKTPGLNGNKPKINDLCYLFRTIKKRERDTACYINTGIESKGKE